MAETYPLQVLLVTVAGWVDRHLGDSRACSPHSKPPAEFSYPAGWTPLSTGVTHPHQGRQLQDGSPHCSPPGHSVALIRDALRSAPPACNTRRVGGNQVQ